MGPKSLPKVIIIAISYHGENCNYKSCEIKRLKLPVLSFDIYYISEIHKRVIGRHYKQCMPKNS